MTQRKTILAISAILMALIIILPVGTAFAEPARSGVTATTTVNLRMRSGPGTGFGLLDVIPAGTTVPVVGRNADNSWLLVQYNGATGWCAGWYTTTNGNLGDVPVTDQMGSGGGTSGLNPTGVIATPTVYLRIRSQATTNSEILGVIPINTPVDVLGRNGDSSWVFIRYGTTEGWCAAWLMSINGNLTLAPVVDNTGGTGSSGGSDPAPAPAPGGVTAAPFYTINFRSGPGTNHSIIGSVPGGASVQVTGRNADSSWAQVNYNGTSGWLAAWLLAINGDINSVPVVGSTPAPQPTPVPQPQPGVVTATPSNNLNFRSGPGTNYSVIGSVPGGTTVTVIGRNSDSSWVKVDYNGTIGWLAGWLVTISGDINSVPVESTPTPTPEPTPAPAPAPAPSSGFELGGQTHTFANPGVMSSAGMTWVKRQHKWSPGDNPGDLAGMINQAHAAGFKILISIPGHLYPSSIDFNSYTQYVAGVAALGADAIEIWNEMNLDREWPAGQISPSSYVNSMLRPAYQAIKAANPGTMVISGALAPTGVHNVVTVWSDDIYLAGMRDAGAANYMDCVGVHHNAGATSPYATSGHPADPGVGHYSWYYQGTFNLYANTFPTRQVCFTEIGYMSPEGYGTAPPNFSWGQGTSVAEHAQWLGDAARLARQSGRVRLFIVFNVDIMHWGDDPQAGYAIIRPGGSCPACSTLAGSLY